MAPTIAVGVDLSEHGQLVLQHAVAVARRLGAQLVLVHVGVVPEDPIGIPASMESTAHAYREVLARRLEADRRRLEELHETIAAQGVQASQVVVDGFADTGLAEAAARLRADLIVVGSHGRTGLRRLVLGSVAEKTVRLAESSVLIARGAAAPGGYARITVGVDFSPLGDVAIARALELAAANADVHLIHAWQVPGYEGGGEHASLLAFSAETRLEIVEAAQQAGARLLAAHADAPVRLRFDCVEAPAIEAITTTADQDRSDLVVVGSHGHRGIRRLLLGSTAEATVRHAPCSVLVAR